MNDENITPASTSVFKGSSQVASIKRLKNTITAVIATQATRRRQRLLARIVRWFWPGYPKA